MTLLLAAPPVDSPVDPPVDPETDLAPHRAPALEWRILYPDGRAVTNHDCAWNTLAEHIRYDGLSLFLLPEEIASLTVFFGQVSYTLHCSDPETRYYRHFRLGQSLSTTQHYVVHAIGYLHRRGRMLYEVDERGAVTAHSFPSAVSPFTTLLRLRAE